MLHRAIVLSFLTLLVSLHSASGVIFMVTTNGDSGPGSLRQAILDANATPGPDAIHFNIGSGPQTIRPLTGLPWITDSAVIDGRTQPGYAGVPLIELDGSAVFNAGLALVSRSNTVVALVINRFHGPGILLGNYGENFLAGNYLGTDRTGTVAMPNENGVAMTNSSANQIGLANGASRNLISGNRYCGIVLARSSNNVIEGNYIGTDITGNSALGNQMDGICLSGDAAYNNIGTATAGGGNVISGNGGNGILAFFGYFNVIEGNRIGCNPGGDSAIPNRLCGINLSIHGGTTIGGTVANARNVISGNDVHGIEIGGSEAGTVVQGNFVGLQANGLARLANGGSGIFIHGSTDISIGGSEPGSGNVISGNAGNGLWMSQASNNVVQGNLIGLDHTGTAIVANDGAGVLISRAGDNLIGGEGDARNVISGNQRDGIQIVNSIGDVVQGNYIGCDISGDAAAANGWSGLHILGSSFTCPEQFNLRQPDFRHPDFRCPG
jgi:parallel beta-helix repeat protein